MQNYLVSPHLVDLILLLTVVEAVVLILLGRRLPVSSPPNPSSGPDTRRRPIAIILMLVPGICLMLALRAALDDAAWPWVPAALSAALLAHVADIRERWRG